MLQYPLDGEIKSGVIKLNFGLNSYKTEMDYLGIEYGDPAVLTKIEALNKWN
jgi:hypothetical protein